MPLFEDSSAHSRRAFFELLARAAAVPAAAPFLSAWLRAQSPGPAPMNMAMSAPPEPPLLANYQPVFFAGDDFAALAAFTSILIPTDDTPGAREAHVAAFIDFLLQSSIDAAPGTVRQWRQAMTALRTAGFHGADAAGRLTIVDAMARPERDRTASHPAYAAYRLIKQQATFAFYTSRVGMIDVLDYRGNRYNMSFPPCDHPEHHVV